MFPEIPPPATQAEMLAIPAAQRERLATIAREAYAEWVPA
jgi:hypothetical protein